MALQEEHDPPGVAHQLLLACLDCSKNSKANNDVTEEEAFAYYTNAIGRVKELVALMEARYGKDKVLMVMEFPHSEPVQKLLLKAFPELRCRRIQAHLFERRDRVYYCRGYDPEMAYFKQALDEAIDDAGGDDRCAAEGLKLAAEPVREKSRLYGTRSSKPTRKKAFDEDRGLDPLKAKFPTIYVNGVRIKWGKDESEEMRIPNEAILFIRTYGGAHKYFLPVAENNRASAITFLVWASRQSSEPRWRAARGWVREKKRPLGEEPVAPPEPVDPRRKCRDHLRRRCVCFRPDCRMSKGRAGTPQVNYQS